MSSDIMRYVGGAVPSERRVPQVNLLASEMSISTTARSVECDWTGYDMILVEAMFYSNVMASIMVPLDYFAATQSNARVMIWDPVNSQRFEVYKNDDSHAYVRANQAEDSRYGVRIYGVLFGE